LFQNGTAWISCFDIGSKHRNKPKFFLFGFTKQTETQPNQILFRFEPNFFCFVSRTHYKKPVFRIRKFLGLSDPLARDRSGSFHHQAKRVKKTLVSTVLWPFDDFLTLKNYVKVPSKSNKQKPFEKNKIFLLASCRSRTKKAGSRAETGFASTDLYQNLTDPKLCTKRYIFVEFWAQFWFWIRTSIFRKCQDKVYHCMCVPIYFIVLQMNNINMAKLLIKIQLFTCLTKDKW
jgi:hypothetical protein